MFKGLLIAVLCTGLAACGSSSDKPTLNVDFEEFKGRDANPDLADVIAIDGSEITINSRLQGRIETEVDEVNFIYEAMTSQQVALFLNSSAEDFDLSVTGGDVIEGGFSDDSNEAVLFNAVAGQSYNIKIDSYGGFGDFELVIVEATRATLGLSNNEYFYRLGVNFSESCDDDSINTYKFNTYVVINFKDGYLEFLSTNERSNFDRVNGNSFVIDTEIEDDGFSFESSAVYTVDLTDASVSGSETGSTVDRYYDVDENEAVVEACTFTNIIESELLF